MIPQETIEQIREATDIAQVVGEFIKLKRRGRNFLALCPFHTEKTPSFSISSDKQIYHCFGCGKGGNVFTFLIEHESMSFVEAVKYLAGRANITIREDKQASQRGELLDRLGYANEVAQEYFRDLLRKPKFKSVLKDYLQTRRQIKPETIEEFGLGLTDDSWEGLIGYARRKDVKPEDLQKAGVASYSDNKKKYFDRFRQRLMIPIYGLSGKIIAFGGRTLRKGEPAKYVNSPETPLYVKGNVLYGLSMAKNAIREQSSVYVVEGYFDVISMWQAGIKNVVASSGTAFTMTQARLLARFADEVILFFDADSAGHKAALRSVDVLYDAGVEVKLITAPGGADPDSIARTEGRERIEQLRKEAVGFIAYRSRDISLDEAGIIGKERIIKEFAAMAARISDPTRRAVFMDEAATALRIERDLLLTTELRAPAETSRPAKEFNAVESGLLSVLFCNPGSIDAIATQISPSDFNSSELGRLYAAAIQQYRDLGEINAGTLIDRFDDNESAALTARIASIEWESGQVDTEARNLTGQMLEAKRKRIREKLRGELAQAEADGNQNRAEELLTEIKQYQTDDKTT